MKSLLLQTDIAWNAPAENIARAETLLASAPEEASLIVLPEMWATGFATAPEGIATVEGNTSALRWMEATARRRHCAVSGSLAVKASDGTFRNRHYFVTPNSTIHYDKRHLFTHGNEHRAYTAGGSEAVVASWQGLRWLLLTCYDLRFPVFSRYGRDGVEYDGIIIVANWPAVRREAWEVLVRARAIENQCYVLAVNRVGTDAVTSYSGGTMAIDPVGRTIARATDQEVEAVVAEVSVEALHRARSHFRVLDDRD